MFSNYQSFLQIIFSIVISLGVWVVTSISLLTLPGKIPGESGFINLAPGLPFSQSAKYGLMVGAIHGVLTALINYWHRPQTAIGNIISSFVITEVLIAIGFITVIFLEYFNRPVQMGKPRIDPTLENFNALLITFVFWFFILSVLFLIPSVIAGALNKFFYSVFGSKMN